jgi:carbamoyltransferase
MLAQVLETYAAATGIPVVCNTSANFPGRGFFPDAASAMEWGRIPLVWADGTLYRQRQWSVAREPVAAGTSRA